MQIGQVPAPRGRDRDQPKIGESAADGHSVLLPRLVRTPDHVSISSDLHGRGGEVHELVDRLRDVPPIDEQRVAQVRAKLEAGQLSTREVLEETARRILDSLAE